MWQPIETAPRDGTGILIWVKNYTDMEPLGSAGMPCAVTAKWSDYYNGWELLMAWGYECNETVYGEPTHWIPLPTPPEE